MIEKKELKGKQLNKINGGSEWVDVIKKDTTFVCDGKRYFVNEDTPYSSFDDSIPCHITDNNLASGNWTSSCSFAAGIIIASV